MKNVLNFCAILSICLLTSCTKDTTLDANVDAGIPSSTFYVMDWATGTQIGTLEEIASDRTGDTYYNNMSGATTKYSFQGKFYLGGTLVATSPTYWKDAGFSGALAFSGDNDNDYTMVMTYGRKVLSIPCTLSISWSTSNGSILSPETFVIGANGTSKSHFFPSAN